jgi:integrase/recombinase XerC
MDRNSKLDPKLQDELLSAYDQWMIASGVSAHSQRTYKSQVRAFLVFLGTENITLADLSLSQQQREQVVRSYKADITGWLKPRSINNAIIAVNHFFQFLGLKPVRLRRMLVHQFQRTFSPEEQDKFLAAIDCSNSTKERALAKLIFYTGIKLGQVAALNINDVIFAGSTAKLILRHEDTVEIELDEVVTEALSDWCAERARKFPDTLDQALFLNRYGSRISTTGLDQLLRKIGFSAHLEVSAEVLRRTYVQRELAHSKLHTSLCRPGNP